MARNFTTRILRQAGDFFVAETTDGRLRVGILDTAAIDTAREGERIRAVAAVADDGEFERQAEALFDELYARTDEGDGRFVAASLGAAR